MVAGATAGPVDARRKHYSLGELLTLRSRTGRDRGGVEHEPDRAVRRSRYLPTRTKPFSSFPVELPYGGATPLVGAFPSVRWQFPFDLHG